MHLKEKTLVGGCAGEENGWNTQLLYFTGSSLSRDDKLLFMISDKGGSPNIVMRDLEKGTEKTLTQNSNGTMKSYVYFDYDPETEGSGLDRRPIYNIDGRVQQENLSSYLCVYDTASGAHPHPIYSHDGRRIFFNSRSGRYVKVYCVDVKDRLQNSI